MTDAEKALIEINRSLGGIESTVNDIRHCLFGNGQPGLAKRFETLAEQHKSCIEKHKDEDIQKSKIFDRKFAIYAGISTVGIPIVWELIKQLAR